MALQTLLIKWVGVDGYNTTVTRSLLKRAVKYMYMGAANWETKTTGFSCNGIDANMKNRGSSKRGCAMGGCVLVFGSPPRIVLEESPEEHLLHCN